MLTAGYKTALYGYALSSGDNLYFHAIEVLPFAGTEPSKGFSFEQLASADTNVVARCQRKAIQNIHATAIEFFDDSAHLLKQTVKQLCQSVQPLGETTFERQIRCHVVGTHILNS